MAILLVVLLALFSPMSAAQENEESKIPPLAPETIKELILFEFEGLKQEDFNISDIRLLDNRARAILLYHGKELPLQFVCKKTDFGPSWRISDLDDLKTFFNENVSASPPGEVAEETEKLPAPENPEYRTENPEERPLEVKELSAAEKGESYQSFLEGFVRALKEDGEVDFARFYFRDDDFLLENAASEDGDPRETLAKQRQEFVSSCQKLSQQIKKYQTFQIQSSFASSSSKAERAKLRDLMPGARRFRASVSLEVLADGELGKLTIEGLVMLERGWCMGKIASSELP